MTQSKLDAAWPCLLPSFLWGFSVITLPLGQVEIRVRNGQVVGESGGVGEVVPAVVAVPVRLVPVEPLALPRVLRFAESPGKGARKPNHKTNYLQNSRIYRVTMVV